jgi:hypothetical protein
VGRLIHEISDRLETDSVLPLVLSILDDKIERHWVLPMMRGVYGKIEKTDIKIYSQVVVGDIAAFEELSDDMQKIRLLYKFFPGLDELRAAFDAARDMKMNMSNSKWSNSGLTRTFVRDRANFLTLAERLNKKYDERETALERLLEGPPGEATI